MKLLLYIFLLLNFSSGDSKEEVDLGGNFSCMYSNEQYHIYYYPSVSPSPQNSLPQIIWIAIPDVIQLGFNENYILIVSNSSNQKNYWIINKHESVEEKGMTKNEERMQLSNVHHVSLTHFQKLLKQQKINVQPPAYFMKQ